MLCVSSCASVSSQPSVRPAEGTATGNAFRLLLPAGTTITLPDNNAARQVQAVAVNELDLAHSNDRSVTLARPLQLVSPAYIAQRDAAEFTALRAVQNLQDENSRLRAK
jgi:hypothetical protein